MVEGMWGVEWDRLDRQLHEDRDVSGVGSLLNPQRWAQALHVEGAPTTWCEAMDR